MSLIVLITVSLFALYMAWTIGANDVANSMGNAVGSKSITIRKAIILAAICEFSGAVLVGSNVTDTIRKGIVRPDALSSVPEALVLGMACSLLACAIWLHLASWWGMPVSTTHSIVGAVAGFGIAAAGIQAVQWKVMGGIVASWFISPVAGAILGYLGFKLIFWFILSRDRPVRAAIHGWPAVVFVVALLLSISILCDPAMVGRIPMLGKWLCGTHAVAVSVGISLLAAVASRVFVLRHMRDCYGLSLHEQLHRIEGIFAPLVVLTSCSVAFGHGANDVANAIGPMAAVADIMRSGTVAPRVFVPMWVLVLGGVGIVLGLATFGYRVMATIGTKITQLTPSRGVAANIATAATVLVCSRLKLPISTTHILVGAIFGVGFARGLDAVNRDVAKEIFSSWALSVPAAILSAGLFLIGKWAGIDNFIRPLLHAAAGG